MTNYDFFKSVVDGTITDDVKAKAAELLEKEEARLAKAAEKKAEKAAADDEMIEAILGILTEEPQTASDIFAALGEEVIPYHLREEQEKAVKQTKIYFSKKETA